MSGNKHFQPASFLLGSSLALLPNGLAAQTSNRLEPAHASPSACTDSHHNAPADDAPYLDTINGYNGLWDKTACDTSPTIITYAFDETIGEYPEGGRTVHTSPLTPVQREQLKSVFAEYERIANIRFVAFAPGTATNVRLEKENENKPMLVYRNASLRAAIGDNGRACSPGMQAGYYLSHTIEFDPAAATGKGENSRQTMTHETGHCLVGWKHPGDMGLGISASRPILPATLDNLASSTMSTRRTNGANPWDTLVYRDDTGNRPPHYMPRGLGWLDMAALHKNFGANMQFHLPNDTARLTGEHKLWTLWNGDRPATLDASAYTGKAPATLNMNQGFLTPAEATHVGEEYMLTAYGPGVTKAIGPKHAPARFIGNTNPKIPSRFEIYSQGSGIEAGKGENQILLHQGSSARIQGFDAKRDRIEAEDAQTLAVITRSGNDTNLTLSTAKGPYAQVTLEDFRGEVSVVQKDSLKPIAVTQGSWQDKSAFVVKSAERVK